MIFQNVEKAAEEDIAQARTLLLNTLNTAAKNKSNLVSLKDIHAMIQAPPLVSTEPSRVGSVKKISVSAGAAAMRDSERCQALADQWIAKLNSSLHDLFEGSMMFAGATVNATLQALNATVVAVTQEQAAVHQAELERVLKGSPVLLQATAEQCRQRMLHLLLPIHRNILQSMLQGSMESFDKRAARLSGVTKLPRLLRLLSAATNQGFALSLDKVRQDFLNMLTLNPAEGLLRSSRTSGGDSGTSGVTNKAAVVSSWKPCFDAGLERRRLQEYTKSRSSERINSLFLSGSYNPYVRDSPLPPIHLNLNYLIDPTAAKLGWEYRSLYDEHKEGPCENRADPLIFPGVAAIPFDPNSHPVPTEKGTSWVTLVRDFFTKE